MSKLVVDDWGQVGAGPYGSLRAHVNAGKLTRATLHAEMGQIVAGKRPGRENETETILFWHRGLSLSDIALGFAMIQKGERLGIAAPVPAGESGARYRSVFVVAAGSRFRVLEGTFGGRFAFNAKGSHSGWNMPRAHLAARGGWYAEEVGPFGPHQLAAAAVA